MVNGLCGDDHAPGKRSSELEAVGEAEPVSRIEGVIRFLRQADEAVLVHRVGNRDGAVGSSRDRCRLPCDCGEHDAAVTGNRGRDVGVMS
jgi:hypothetical protein